MKIKDFFGTRPTNKADVIVAVGAAILAAFKAASTINEFKAEQAKNDINEENEK